MIFNDDEQIVAPQGPRPTTMVPGRVELTIPNKNNVAPLKATDFKVMLELTGGDSGKTRLGLDLVAVLDVSRSMENENKLGKLKNAMLFVIEKLSPIDHLSIVTFSEVAKRECPLRPITEDSQPELENLINGLNVRGGTNITKGLETGLKVLKERSFSSDRVVGIMLMSDGGQCTRWPDAAKVPIGDVPIHTFGFGKSHNPKVLKAITDNNKESTFSSVQNTDDLTKAFSQCLAGLLTVVAQDLQMTVNRIHGNSTIKEVSAGSYLPPNPNYAAGSITLSFGNLYSIEMRKIIVYLNLPKVEEDQGTNVLEIAYSYSFGGAKLDAPPATFIVTRSGTIVDLKESPEVTREETRLRIAQMMKDARCMADYNNLLIAQKKLTDAHKSLKYVVDQSNPMVGILRAEVNQLYRFMKSQEIYERQGRPFALSSETCHEHQRFATRGDMDNYRLFATPRMDKYLKQAESFAEDPSKPVPSVDDDVDIEPGAFYIQEAIKSLQAFEKLFTERFAAREPITSHIQQATESLQAINKLFTVGL